MSPSVEKINNLEQEITELKKYLSVVAVLTVLLGGSGVIGAIIAWKNAPIQRELLEAELKSKQQAMISASITSFSAGGKARIDSIDRDLKLLKASTPSEDKIKEKEIKMRRLELERQKGEEQMRQNISELQASLSNLIQVKNLMQNQLKQLSSMGDSSKPDREIFDRLDELQTQTSDLSNKLTSLKLEFDLLEKKQN